MLQGNSYIVTGASRGFGLAFTRALLAAGANVGMVSRNDELLQRTVEELESDQVIGIAADVADAGQIDSAFARIKAHFGGLNGLVNNAGLARPSSIEHLNREEVMLQVKTNYLGTVFCSQAVIPLLRGENNPRIINISSASARHFDEMSHLSIYASTKAAVERFSRDLAFELQPDGIGVTCIRPGGADTSFAEGWDLDAMSRGVSEWHRTGPHMNVGMDVDDVAAAVVHCLAYPQHVSVDLLEVRPKQLADKLKL